MTGVVSYLDNEYFLLIREDNITIFQGTHSSSVSSITVGATSSSGDGESFPPDRRPRRVPLRTGGGGGCFFFGGALDFLDFALDFLGGAGDSLYNRLSMRKK